MMHIHKAALLLAGCLVATSTFSQKQSGETEQTGPRYLPEFTSSGELILPKNFNEWVFVGAPLTPDGLNGGKAGFPEFHNVYIERGSYSVFRKTGVFPEGTIMFKELQRVVTPQNANGSRTEASGVGYFPGVLNGADVSVKDSTRFASTNGWGFFNFHHSEPKAATAVLQPNDKCAGCHTTGAKKDMVWTQFYRLLDH
ncbi:MAG: cytochrome P460 family protein [Gammaproteobacteria bacterium]|nr:cytochrome P460 family protein [Gammaproteobacteria bacterium]